MGVGDDIDAGKGKDVGGYDIGPGILDVGGPAADIENAALRDSNRATADENPGTGGGSIVSFPTGRDEISGVGPNRRRSWSWRIRDQTALSLR